MAKLLSASALADRALREIGTFSINDLSADPNEHEVALEFLDLIIDELAGTENLWFLQPARQSVAIPATTRTFSLSGLITTRLQFISSVRLTVPEDTSSTERLLPMVRRAVYDAIETKDDSGDPELIYIERNDRPNASVWPTASRTGLMLVIDGQQYADTASDSGGKNTLAFPAAWQRFLIKRLAADIGSGPVRKIPDSEIATKKQDAKEAFGLLMSRNNREQIERPRMVTPYDPLCGRATVQGPTRRWDYGE